MKDTYTITVSGLTDAKHAHGAAAALVAKLLILKQIKASLLLL